MVRRNKENSIFARIFAGIVLPVLFFSIGFIFWKNWDSNTGTSTRDNVNFIIEHFNSQGKLVDYQREICVSSVDDLKLFVEKGNVRIDYGIITLVWPMEEFVSESWDSDLARIGITRYKDKETGRLRVFYYDEEIERWVH